MLSERGRSAAMYSMDAFGLCGGSVAGADLRTLAESAGAAGFRFITLWPSHFEDALASGLSVADMRSILTDSDVSVSELDPLCTWLPVGADDDGIAAPFYRYQESDFFRIADAIGARSLNVIQASSKPIERSQLVDSLSSLCERASQHDLVVSVEFMAWTPICNLETALEIVRATGRSDCGINVDTWHHFRTGGSIDDLVSLTASDVGAIQLSDVEIEPWDDVLQETARARRMPGDGAGTASGALEAFDRSGIDVPINVEVFSDELRRFGPAQAASLLADKVRALSQGRNRCATS
jgi:sugar phosphate isomerase/epimerase